MMIPKDMVVFLDGDDADGQRRRMGCAAALAERFQAHLVAVFVADRLELHPHASFARGDGLGYMLREHRSRVEAAKEAARRAFEDVGRLHGLSPEWRVSDGEFGEALMLHARHAAMAILGPPRRLDGQQTVLGLSEDVIFASGRPSLLLPADWSGSVGNRIVVGWNGSREATRAIADAMPFLAAAQTVHVAVIPEQKVNRLLGARPGMDITRHLVRHGVSAVLEQLEGPDAGRILLDRARDVGADMIVMGAYGQPKITEFVFGSATRTLLETIELPVFLSR